MRWVSRLPELSDPLSTRLTCPRARRRAPSFLPYSMGRQDLIVILQSGSRPDLSFFHRALGYIPDLRTAEC